MNVIYTRITEKELCVNYYSSEPQILQCLKNCRYSCFQQPELHTGNSVSSDIYKFSLCSRRGGLVEKWCVRI
jgi:hypothetical protein